MTNGSIVLGIGLLILGAVAYVWFFIILLDGLLHKKFSSPWFLIASLFYGTVTYQIGYKIYIRTNIDSFIERAEAQRSTSPLEDLNSLRIGPVDENGKINFCIENEGDPAARGFRYCNVHSGALVSTIVPTGGIFETGLTKVQRWHFETESEKCLNPEVSSRDLSEVTRVYSYSGVTAIRGMCYLLEDVETSGAKYLLSGGIKRLPFTWRGDYLELILTNQETGEVVDRLVEVRHDSVRRNFSVFWALTMFVKVPNYLDNQMVIQTTGPIPQIMRYRPPTTRDSGTVFRQTWIEEIAATIQINDDLAIRAIEAAQDLELVYIYRNITVQICKEWNFIGPTLRAEMSLIASESRSLRNCGITNCMNGLGRDAQTVQCENPRSIPEALD